MKPGRKVSLHRSGRMVRTGQNEIEGSDGIRGLPRNSISAREAWISSLASSWMTTRRDEGQEDRAEDKSWFITERVYLDIEK